MPLWNRCGAFIPSEGGKHRLPHDVVDELEASIESAALVNASFDHGNTVQITLRSENGHESVFKGSVTDFIRERVKLHHGGWVIAPLQRILAWSLSKDDGSMGEYKLTDRLDSDWPNPETVDELRKEIARLTEVEAAYNDIRDRIAKLKEQLP